MTLPSDPNEVLRLVALLRQIDQLLYKVSQSPDWETMRPHITALCEGMYDRMRDESDRIRTLMIPQIREAYLNAAPQADEAKPQSSRLEGPRDAGHPGVSDAGRDEEDANRS